METTYIVTANVARPETPEQVETHMFMCNDATSKAEALTHFTDVLKAKGWCIFCVETIRKSTLIRLTDED